MNKKKTDNETDRTHFKKENKTRKNKTFIKSRLIGFFVRFF